jgi:hypothetical protein
MISEDQTHKMFGHLLIFQILKVKNFVGLTKFQTSKPIKFFGLDKIVRPQTCESDIITGYEIISFSMDLIEFDVHICHLTNSLVPYKYLKSDLYCHKITSKPYKYLTNIQLFRPLGHRVPNQPITTIFFSISSKFIIFNGDNHKNSSK